MAWDRTKPVASSNVESPAVRANMQAIDQAMWGRNLACDSNFLIWHKYAQMAHWPFSGTGTPSRETTTIKNNKHSAKIIYGGSGTDKYVQEFLHNATTAGYFAGIPFSAGCWVKSNTVSAALKIDDGADSGSGVSDGTNTWEWVTVTHTLDASPTKLALEMNITGAGTIYYSLPTFVLGPIPPRHPIPSHVVTPVILQRAVGDPPSTGVFMNFHLNRPWMIIDAMLEGVSVNGSTTPFILDLLQYTGTASLSMFKSTDRPTMATGVARGVSQPTLSGTASGAYAGAYHHACFIPTFGSSAPGGGQCKLNIDQSGTDTGGPLNPVLQLRTLHFPNPWEAYSSYDEYK